MAEAPVLAHALWLSPLCALLWRFQGGAWFADRLPSRPAYYVAVGIGACVGAAAGSLASGIAAALGALGVSLWPHGRWYTLGRLPRDASGRAASFVERCIEAACDGAYGSRDDTLCLAFAKLCAFLPVTALAIWWRPDVDGIFFFPILAGLIIVLGYSIGWTLHERGRISAPTAVGEFAAGAWLGACLSPLV